MPKIHFNGKTYNDIAEMPATEREMYDQLMSVMVDENGNGIPDLLEGDVVSNIIEIVKKSSGDNEGIVALEQMSPEMRDRISKGFAKLQEFGLFSGIPDLGQISQISMRNDTEIRPSKPIVQPPSVIQEDKGPRVMLILVVALMILLCAFGAAAYFLFQ